MVGILVTEENGVAPSGSPLLLVPSAALIASQLQE